MPLLVVPTTDSKNVRELYWKLPEHMHEEHKKEYLATNERIKYDLRFAKSDQQQKSLPNVMTQLYNASIYGQLTTSLIDNMIIPATHTLDLKAIALDKEVCILYNNEALFINHELDSSSKIVVNYINVIT